MELPLFPLNTVLFPGALMPLHIFEPRYRQMIGECIDEERPFGVVLIRRGVEAGGEAEPHNVGVTARITEVERFEDGRMNIETVGGDRFRILETASYRPYLTGMVEFLDEYDGDTTDAGVEAERVRALFLELFQLTLAMRGEWTRRVATPPAPGRLADYAAARLPDPTDRKQRWLEELSVPRRLTAVAGGLEEAIRALTPRAEGVKRMRVTGFATLN